MTADRPVAAPGAELLALKPGHTLHEYVFQSVLGSGGFGLTYLATDTNLNLRVAIKEYLPSDIAIRVEDSTVHPRSGGAAESFRWGLRRFLDEARVLAAFQHRNIVRVLRFFEANNTAYMVMEYESGEALRDWVTRHRPLPEARLLRLVDALLDGLAMIHTTGFLHRDIKPGNIIVRADGNPVLLDFGAARHLGNSDGRELTAVVTPGYAPFEQYHSHGNQGAWSDLYSLSAVLYWIVTGHRPMEAAARVKRDTLAPAVSAGDRDTYSLELLSAIDWGLHPDEDRRPKSVAEFRAALRGNLHTPESSPIEDPEPRTTRARGVEIDVSNAADPAAVDPASQPPSQPVSQPLTTGPVFFDPETLAAVETALASHLGPVAPVMVRRAARRTGDFRAFILNLANEIDDDQAKADFLSRVRELDRDAPSRVTMATRTITATSASPPSGPSRPTGPSQPPTGPSQAPGSFAFAPETLAMLETELSLHLGPLARVLIRKASAKARDEAELYLLLADHIKDPAQRKAFVRKSLAAFSRKP
jgi:serine/threonine protein kinase